MSALPAASLQLVSSYMDQQELLKVPAASHKGEVK